MDPSKATVVGMELVSSIPEVSVPSLSFRSREILMLLTGPRSGD